MSFLINPYVHGSGAPAPPTFPSITDIWEWWEPDREGLANNDPISQLTGQVAPGAGHNFVQATGVSQPTYLANQINGAGIANFAVAGANSDWMNGVAADLLTAVHFFIVIRIPTDPPLTAQIAWAFGTDTLPDAYPFTDSSIYAGPFSTTRRTIGDPAISLAAWRVVEVISTSSEWTWRIDGATSGTGVFFTTGTNTVGVLGSGSSCHLGSDRNGANWANIDLAGIYICSAKLTADRAAMVSYINTRFALSMS